jgi:hypothetical protein
MKDSPGGNGTLIFTILTLIQFSGRNERKMSMSASWANKTMGPSLFKQKINTTPFGREFALKFK